MERTKRDNLAAILLSILLSYLTYLIIQYQLTGILADYNGHAYVYLPMFTNGSLLEGWKAVPYCMWHVGVLVLHYILHIPYEVAVAYTSIVFSMLSFYVIYWMLLRYTAHVGKEMNSTKAAFITFGLSIVQGLHFFWLDAGQRFLGSFSMNPLHNPTQMAVNPFALLCFCLVYDIWNKQKDESYKGVFFNMGQGLKRPYIYLAVILLLSVLAKPTFAEMFIPAVAIIMLVEWIGKICKKDGSAAPYFKQCLNMLYCAIPALIYILVSFLAYFVFGGSYGADAEGGLIITKWMEVWSMFTENIVLSMGLGLAFPLFVIMIDTRFFLQDNLGRLAVIGYLIGFLEAALLGEGGGKLGHADFIWPMMSGMLLLFVSSTLRLSVLERTEADSKVKCVLIDIAWAILCLHVLCGYFYIRESMGLL